MADDLLNDKYSIKNLLFTKAIPNYKLPVPINGHKVYACIDCGDKYIFESSYNFHIQRKSVKISYMCRPCNTVKIFYNRCTFLSHIRSHAKKTATINVIDLKVDPLPLNFYNIKPVVSKTAIDNVRKRKLQCYECGKNILCTSSGGIDRARHYKQQFTADEVHTCPVCLFNLPTVCAFKSHLRLHLKRLPYFCTDCGSSLPNKCLNNINRFNHNCEGLKMFRASARIKCPVGDCPLYHPSEFEDHVKSAHITKVYKCPFCYVGCVEQSIMEKHMLRHAMKKSPGIFFQCELCPGRLVLESQLQAHLRSHNLMIACFPCWSCNAVFQNVISLIEHYIERHATNDVMKNAYQYIIQETPRENIDTGSTNNQPTDPDQDNQTTKEAKGKRLYRVIKRCEKCKRSFTYKCQYDQIKRLPISCPYECTIEKECVETNEAKLTCYLCKEIVSHNWEDIKKHFAAKHQAFRCIDLKVLVSRLDKKTIKKYTNKKKKATKRSRNRSRKNMRTKQAQLSVIPKLESSTVPRTDPNDQFSCGKCGQTCENKVQLETHLMIHRDPCMAYQCMECGHSFVVKPSFSKHLLLEHGVSDIEDYISKKQCYNESALQKYQVSPVVEEPLKENQCNICRNQFDNADDLEKHFRVHGMAFLLKNKSLSP